MASGSNQKQINGKNIAWLPVLPLDRPEVLRSRGPEADLIAKDDDAPAL
jgi:hypothetical protein